MGRLVGSATTITQENDLAKGKITRLVSWLAKVVFSVASKVSPLAKCSKRGVSAGVDMLFVGLVCGGVDLALTMGHRLDDEGGECSIVTGKLWLGWGLTQSFSYDVGAVASFCSGR